MTANNKPSKTITRFTKSFIMTCVANKIAQPNLARDYDIVKAHEAGTSYGRLAIKYGLSRDGIKKIIDKYRSV
jgi:Mor family transcriptional regulator